MQFRPPEKEPALQGPLAGVQVIDCSTILAGPLAGQLLGDFGAEVVKVEHPSQPDGLRGHGASIDGVGLWWKEVARNKKPIGLDLSSPDGSDLMRRLLEDADVLIENFRPGTLERWGLDPDELLRIAPQLIILRVTGFGQEGPYSSRPAFGTLIEAMSGFAHLTGHPDGPPTLPPFGLADSIAGIAGAAAVAMALFHRETNGGFGQVIDLSLLETMMMAVGPAPMVYHKTGELASRNGNRSPNNAPRNLYWTRDGAWVAVSTSATAIARKVMELVGHPEVISEPWFETGQGRAAHGDLLDGYVAEWIGARTADEVMSSFAEAGAAVAPVYTPADLVDDPHIKARKSLVEVVDEEVGNLLMHNVPWRYSETPGAIRFTGRRHGEDTSDILLEKLGLRSDEVARLRERRIVR